MFTPTVKESVCLVHKMREEFTHTRQNAIFLVAIKIFGDSPIFSEGEDYRFVACGFLFLFLQREGDLQQLGSQEISVHTIGFGNLTASIRFLQQH